MTAVTAAMLVAGAAAAVPATRPPSPALEFVDPARHPGVDPSPVPATFVPTAKPTVKIVPIPEAKPPRPEPTPKPPPAEPVAKPWTPQVEKVVVPRVKPAAPFTAGQKLGSSAEVPPYDVFWGTAPSGAPVGIWSPYGGTKTVAGESGEWEAKVYFPKAPAGVPFEVKVKTAGGDHKTFTFTFTGGEGEPAPAPAEKSAGND